MTGTSEVKKLLENTLTAWINVTTQTHTHTPSVLMYSLVKGKDDYTCCLSAANAGWHSLCLYHYFVLSHYLNAFSYLPSVFPFLIFCVPCRVQSPGAPLAGYNNLEVAEYLLEHGADVNAQDKGGLIPLHNAASYGVRCTRGPINIYKYQCVFNKLWYLTARPLFN